ncbi:MAG: HemY protein N-terminus [Pseudomonadota bacterium]|jgi:uncharacterized protein HemY
MRNIFWKLIAIILTMIIIWGFAQTNQGNVIIYLAEYRIKLSLNVLIGIWLISLILSYSLIRLWKNLYQLPAKFRQLRSDRIIRRNRINLSIAEEYYFANNYALSYRYALKVAKYDLDQHNLLIAYILAYKSAQLLKDSDKCTAIKQQLENNLPIKQQQKFTLLTNTHK